MFIEADHRIEPAWTLGLDAAIGEAWSSGAGWIQGLFQTRREEAA